MRTRAIVGVIGLLILAAALAWLNHHTSRYDSLIRQAAIRNGVDFYLAKALIYEESWFRPQVRGSAGELGLMQITRAAASDFASHKGRQPYTDARLIEPELNIEIGCWYLGQSVERYKNSPMPNLFALLRYNAGESRADAWLRYASSSPALADISMEDYCLSFVDFPKTRLYARHILKRSRTHNYWY
jgi:soluble lytic murein transglycosylase